MPIALLRAFFLGLVILSGAARADVKYVAHRGEEGLAPEGSRPAYELAVRHKLDIMKLDLAWTKDHVVVTSHDPGLKRTMGWDVRINDVTYAEIKEKGVFLPVGGYGREKILTFKEALEISKALPELWLDFKFFTPEFAEQVLEELDAAGVTHERVMIATFNRKALCYFRDKHPEFRRVLHVSIYGKEGDFTSSFNGHTHLKTRDEVLDSILRETKKLGAWGVNVPQKERKVTPEMVTKLKAAGLWVSVWFVNDFETAELYRPVADAFVTKDAAVVRPDGGQLPAEEHYDFRKRIDAVHTPGLRDPAATKAADEISLADGVTLTLPAEKDDVLRNAVRDFKDYLKVAMGVKVERWSGGEVERWSGGEVEKWRGGEVEKWRGGAVEKWSGGEVERCGKIEVLIEKGVGERTSRIEVGDGGVKIVAGDSRAAAQAFFHLEDVMNLRRGPFLKKGVETRRQRYSPRMSHSGYSLDRFPDACLAQMAHHGLDAALVFVRDIDRGKAKGKTDIADIIRRAKAWGIDTYLYSYIAAYAHPDDPKAKEVFEKTYGRVAAAYPEAKGIVFVGESCQFPSKDPRVWGHEEGLDGVKRPAGETRPAAGWFPCKDYPDWLKAVKAAIDAKSPGMEIVFWTYNWGKQPKVPRLELIDALPKDVTLMATFEMFENYQKRNGFHARVEDYSLSFEGPGQYFVSEAEEAKKVGLKLYSMANTGGSTWDFGSAPYEPFPFQWKRRWDGVNAAQEKWGLSGLMENHHYGWTPSFISELAKEAYTDGGLAFGEHLRKIAERDFGAANADAAIAVWREWSDAIRDQTTGAINQYTFLRIGPAYPFAFGGAPLDDKDFPYPENAAEVSGMFVMNYPVYDGPGDLQGFTDRDDELGLEVELLDSAATTYLRGAERFRAMAGGLRGFQRERAIRMANLGEYMGRTLVTGKHVKEGCRVMRAGGDKAKLREIAVREYANTLAARELLVRDSGLGWEPTMEYQGSYEQIDWKLAQMRRVYGFADGAPAGNLADKVWTWGYVLDRTPSACPFVTVKTSSLKTDWSLEREIAFLGAKRQTFYMNSMFNRDYIRKHFPGWDEECFTNCIDTKLSDAHFDKLSDVGEVWCALEHGNRTASAEAIARLSLRHRNIAGINLDDFNNGMAATKMSPAELKELRERIRAINPALKIAVVTYAHPPNEFDMTPFAPYVDVVSRWCWKPRHDFWDNYKAEIAKLRKQIGPKPKVLQGLYIRDFGTSMKDPRPMPIDVFRKSVETVRAAILDGTIDGVIVPQAGWFGAPEHAAHVKLLKDAFRNP